MADSRRIAPDPTSASPGRIVRIDRPRFTDRYTIGFLLGHTGPSSVRRSGVRTPPPARRRGGGSAGPVEPWWAARPVVAIRVMPPRWEALRAVQARDHSNRGGYRTDYPRRALDSLRDRNDLRSSWVAEAALRPLEDDVPAFFAGSSPRPRAATAEPGIPAPAITPGEDSGPIRPEAALPSRWRASCRRTGGEHP